MEHRNEEERKMIKTMGRQSFWIRRGLGILLLVKKIKKNLKNTITHAQDLVCNARVKVA